MRVTSCRFKSCSGHIFKSIATLLMMTDKSKESTIIILSALLVFVIRLLSFFIYDVYDDAFITFRYAYNLSSGNGLVYNIGENILGTTSPLFAIILSLFFKIGLPMPDSAVILNILLDTLTVFFISKILLNNNKIIELGVFLFIFSGSVLISRITIGGMEVNLFLLMSVITINLYLKEKKVLAVIICSIAYFIRPEALSLLLILFLNDIFTKQYKHAFFTVIISIATLSIPLIFMYQIYGNILPQSVLSKSELTGSSLIELINMFFLRDPISIITLPLALIGISRIHKTDPFLKLFGFWILLLIVSYAIIRPHPWPWYSFVIRVGLALFSGVGFVYLLGYLEKFKKLFTFQRIAIFSFIIALFANLATAYTQGFKPVTKNIYYPLKNWAKSNKKINKTLIADDIGIIGYLFKGRIIDTQGLISSKFVKKEERLNFFLSSKADYLFLNSNQENINLIFNTKLKDFYEPILRFSKSGNNKIIQNADDYPQGWIQDYILLKKF
ncbi:MAG: hypothetical protein N2319_09960 [Candidatus Kapabacteria bacterium]|nr:hypothetical protein [Candidatus Kapabacteria bacterium]